MTHSNLGTLERPAAGSCVITAPESRSCQAANGTLAQYLEQLHCKEFCQSVTAGALNLCAHYLGWCCNTQQLIFTITASPSSTFPITFDYRRRTSRPEHFTGTLIPHHCIFWTHPDEYSLPHSYWDLKTPPSDCDCKPGLIKALWKRSILEPFKKKKGPALHHHHHHLSDHRLIHL